MHAINSAISLLALCRPRTHWEQATIRLHLLHKHQVRFERLNLCRVCLLAIHPHLQVFVGTQVFQRGVPFVCGCLAKVDGEGATLKSSNARNLLCDYY